MTPAGRGAVAEARLDNSPAAQVPHSPPDERAATGIPPGPTEAGTRGAALLPRPVGYFPARATREVDVEVEAGHWRN